MKSYTRQLALATIVILLLVLIAQPPIFYVLSTGDFPGAARFYGLQEDDTFVSLLLWVHRLFVR